jgi:hypothetical protein
MLIGLRAHATGQQLVHFRLRREPVLAFPAWGEVTVLGAEICRLGNQFVAALGRVASTAEYQWVKWVYCAHDDYLQLIQN